MQRCLIVAGFHRSGTSFVTQVLSEAGLFLGEDLLGSNPSNPYGHLEDREVIRLHDRIFTINDRSWRVDEEFLPIMTERVWDALREFVDRRRRHHVLWGFKDPRVTLFLPIWKHVIPEAKVLGVIRHYADSTYSLERRHSEQLFRGIGSADLHREFWSTPELALRMWLVHNRGLLRHAAAHPDEVMVVDTELIRGGFPLVDELDRRWGIRLDGADGAALFDPTVTRRRPAPMRPISEQLQSDLDKTWAELGSLRAATEASWKEIDG